MDRFKMKTYSRKNSSYLKKAFVASNFNEMCRLCLSEIDLGLTPIVQGGDKLCYQEWIEFGVDVTVEEGDGLPPNICEDCLAMVEQTYLFKKKCKASDKKLREHMELVEHSDENRHHDLGFSDLEDEQNLFRRNEATQSNHNERSAIDSGGKAQATQTDDNDDEDDDEDEDECTFKDVINILKEKKKSRGVQSANGKKTKDSEQQTDDIPKQDEKKMKITAKNKGSQGNISKGKSLIMREEKKTTDDEEDDDDDDSSYIEVVSLDKEDESVRVADNLDEDSADEYDCFKRNTEGENSGTMLREIYDQWECDDSPQGEEENAGTNDDTDADHDQDTNEDTNDDTNEDTRGRTYDHTNMGMYEDANGDTFENMYGGTNGGGYEDANADLYQGINPDAYRDITGGGYEDSSTDTYENPFGDANPDSSEDEIAIHFFQIGLRNNCEEHPHQVNRIYQSKNKIEVIETVPSKTRYCCCACLNTYESIPDLKTHLTTAHRISESSSCEVCYKTFTCANSLRRHMLVHTGSKPYKCRICGRSFAQTATLKRHVLTHEDTKPFVCHHCNKSYTQKVNLISHLKTHGLFDEGLYFGCKSCNKSFVHQSGLSRHTKEHKGFRFLCGMCKRSFTDPSALQRHVKIIHLNKSPTLAMLNNRSRASQ